MDLGPELLVIDHWNFKGFLDLKAAFKLFNPEANKCSM